ncbi:hypothetical protein NLG97_g6966 [Lecanicillium saksenae]|uniref:Uncharacterized protein n=1 Tax=Lecanicillium saksenae TaxID=468837 RepID=A0ACC1QQP8_9HYPO|nr:hypothetical protein NLG97_g6966 [Lecanicillium saksenae]
MPANDIELNGWTAMPLDAGKLFDGRPYRNAPTSITIADIVFPFHDAIVSEIDAFAKDKLPPETYNHSMRVFYFASAILRDQFPEHFITLSSSTLALSCLLHDIGTAPDYLTATRMSFEYYGGLQALRVLDIAGATVNQAEAVCECIIRHQDLGTDGSITFLGQLIQLATIYDNVSDHPHLAGLASIIHADTREDVIRAFPRKGWLGCFAATAEREVALKPWCHTTHLPSFGDKIRGNKLMAQYE